MSSNTVLLKIRNYKCFGDGFSGFDTIRPINVIIGRNNCGKSTLLELAQHAVSPMDLPTTSPGATRPEVLFETALSVEDVQKVFVPGKQHSGLPRGMDLWDVGQHCVGKKLGVLLPLKGDENRGFVRFETDLADYAKPFHGQLAQCLTNPFASRRFRRLRAERSIQPEVDSEPYLHDNGTGATNIVQAFINKAWLPSKLVEDTLLEELNKIMEPDASFTDIVVQQDKNKFWEVYLEEKEKGRVALSQSGSGLQTVLLVLILLYLVPHLDKRQLSDYVFAFEELENNVHPALQRRLLMYIRAIAVNTQALFFMTTHSHVVIDLFSTDPQAQLVHVTHNGHEARTRSVEAYTQCRGVFDDLDVRASDLLQSNGVVWVEGPSDRLYFNKWLHLWTNGELREGVHYQCIFYGGRLLAHLSAVPSDEMDCDGADALKILRVNRNAIIIVDSDKRYKRGQLNRTKKRILEEMANIDAMCWVTKGREVENYVPSRAVACLYKKTSVGLVGTYESFADYLDRIQRGEGKRFSSAKVVFAERICCLLQREDIEPILDLALRLDEACARIRKWNGAAS